MPRGQVMRWWGVWGECLLLEEGGDGVVDLLEGEA